MTAELVITLHHYFDNIVLTPVNDNDQELKSDEIMVELPKAVEERNRFQHSLDNWHKYVWQPYLDSRVSKPCVCLKQPIISVPIKPHLDGKYWTTQGNFELALKSKWRCLT